MTDPIADMLTRIRNANQMRNKEVSMPVSKIKVEKVYDCICIMKTLGLLSFAFFQT